MPKLDKVEQILDDYKFMIPNGTERGYSGKTKEEAIKAIRAYYKDLIESIPSKKIRVECKRPDCAVQHYKVVCNQKDIIKAVVRS